MTYRDPFSNYRESKVKPPHPKTHGNTQIIRFGNFGLRRLKFSQNVHNQKVNWQCNNFGPEKGQPHPKTPGNTQISCFGNFDPLGLKFSQNVRNQKVNWQCNNFGLKKGQPHPKTSMSALPLSPTYLFLAGCVSTHIRTHRPSVCNTISVTPSVVYNTMCNTISCHLLNHLGVTFYF